MVFHVCHRIKRRSDARLLLPHCNNNANERSSCPWKCWCCQSGTSSLTCICYYCHILTQKVTTPSDITSRVIVPETVVKLITVKQIKRCVVIVYNYSNIDHLLDVTVAVRRRFSDPVNGQTYVFNKGLTRV